MTFEQLINFDLHIDDKSRVSDTNRKTDDFLYYIRCFYANENY